MQKNSLIRKIRLISKIFNVTLETIAIHILTNISRSKGNQTIKFGQLIVYKIRSILLEKSSIKPSGETFLRPFPKKSKLSISLDQIV